MLCAVVEDLSRISGIAVDATWDRRLGPSPLRGARVVPISSREDETREFERLARECDATLIIAPEFNRILIERCRIVEDCGGRMLGPGSRAVELCTDKLRLAGHLRDAGINTIPTHGLDCLGTEPAFPYPIVIKPRDGAGSQQTYRVDNPAEFVPRSASLCEAVGERNFIVQPWIPGRPVSVALLFSRSGDEVEVLPVADQSLSDDRQFSYRGGIVPAAGVDQERLQSTALAACRTVPRLRGYVGVDLIVPDDLRLAPVVVEINPRLTTSYLGYRALARDNLAEWMLLPNRFQRTARWHGEPLEFVAAGNISRLVDRDFKRSAHVPTS
jgi:predicted ATP-grasp superfamily ATP-dependent carboligase